MLYKLNDRYYVKVYENRYSEVVFKEIDGEINLVPTENSIEPTSKFVECDITKEKEMFKNKSKIAFESKSSKYKKY